MNQPFDSQETKILDRRPKGAKLTNSHWNEELSESAFAKPSAIESKSIPDLFFSNAKANPKSWFSRIYDIEDGIWDIVNWQDAAEQVKLIAAHLLSLGVKRGERVAILSGTRHEWVIADLAILSIGAVSVAVYQTLIPKEVAYILLDSGAEHVFCENEEQLQKLIKISSAPQPIPETENLAGGNIDVHIKTATCFEAPVSSTALFKVLNFSNAVKNSSLDTAKVQQLVESLSREDIASIVYTSGTTGAAKGVVQTHGNHLAMLNGVMLSRMVDPCEGLFLFLPLAHSFARIVAYAAISAKGDLVFPTVLDKIKTIFDAKQLFKDINRSNPAIFPSVPRLFEKIMSNLSSTATRGEKIINWAVRKYQASNGENFISKKIVAIVKKKIFGSKLSHAISGGAPISPEVVKFFKAIDVPILEGYGLTETCPALTVNTKKYWKVGTVGRPFEGVELKIAADGEILCRGDNIAKGYWNKPIATREVFLDDGWFATGDIGEIDHDGFLKITDRKKEIIVSAGGKNVAPALIEGMLKNSPFISQACVYGDKRSYIVGLITLDFENIKKWAEERSIQVSKSAEYAAHPLVFELITAEIDRINSDLAPYEKVRKFKILSEDFTIENGFLTPTLKIKRKLVYQHFASEIDSLY